MARGSPACSPGFCAGVWSLRCVEETGRQVGGQAPRRGVATGVSAMYSLSVCRNGQAQLYSSATSMRGSGGLLSLAVFTSDRAALPRYGDFSDRPM